MKNNTNMAIFLTLTILVSLYGCSIDPLSKDGAFSNNAAKAYIYTPEEKKGMSPDGMTNRIILPSEIREYMKNKETPPTGEISYCDAGLSQLIASRRKEALAAIAEACGGEDKYRIRREGSGDVNGRYLGNFKLTPNCNRGKVVVFKCTGPEPKPDMRK